MRTLLAFMVSFTLLGCSSGNVRDSSAPYSVSPGVKTDEISVLPNAEFIAKFEIANGKIVSVDTSSASESDQNTMTFELSEMGDKGMMLATQSAVGVTIKFDIEMVDYSGKRHYTSSCPVMPNMGAFETWGHRIPELKISNFRILQESSTVSCQ